MILRKHNTILRARAVVLRAMEARETSLMARSIYRAAAIDSDHAVVKAEEEGEGGAEAAVEAAVARMSKL